MPRTTLTPEVEPPVVALWRRGRTLPRWWPPTNNMDGEVTPNFGREASAQSVRLEPVPELVYPAGGHAGELAAPHNFRAHDVPGHFVNSSLSWNNVGSITVTPRLVGDSYLGAGDLVEFTPSDPIRSEEHTSELQSRGHLVCR